MTFRGNLCCENHRKTQTYCVTKRRVSPDLKLELKIIIVMLKYSQSERTTTESTKEERINK